LEYHASNAVIGIIIVKRILTQNSNNEKIRQEELITWPLGHMVWYNSRTNISKV